MAKYRVNYLVCKRRASGLYAWQWQPNKKLRDAGWKTQKLGHTSAREPSPQVIAAAEEINAQVNEWRAGALKTVPAERPGTIDALIRAYKKSRAFKTLAEQTQKGYKARLDIISRWAGDQAAVAINARMVQDFYDEIAGEKEKPRQAQYIVQVLRVLYNFANDPKCALVPEGFNPAQRIEMSYKAGKGRLWTAEAIAALVAEADEAGLHGVGTAVMLNEWIGQRMGDIIALGLTAFDSEVLAFAQSKTGAEIEIPVDALPAHILERVRMQLRLNAARAKPGKTFIQQESGKPYSADHFSHVMKDLRDKAEKKEETLAGMTFRTLRHTAVTRLGEAGCTPQEIASITGHALKSVETILDIYNVRTRKMAGNALRKRRAAEGV